MKLRLLIDNTSGTARDWYRLEEWEEGLPRMSGLTPYTAPGRWLLVTSGPETDVRRVYERLKQRGEKMTVVETYPLADPALEAQNGGSIAIQPEETSK